MESASEVCARESNLSSGSFDFQWAHTLQSQQADRRAKTPATTALALDHQVANEACCKWLQKTSLCARQ